MFQSFGYQSELVLLELRNVTRPCPPPQDLAAAGTGGGGRGAGGVLRVRVGLRAGQLVHPPARHHSRPRLLQQEALHRGPALHPRHQHRYHGRQG